MWPEESGYDATRKTQRNCIVGAAWPAGEIDEVSTRYIQFGIQAPSNTKIDIDKISFYVAGAGGSGMRCKIYYATREDFADATLIKEFTSMAGNTAYLVESTPVVGIQDGACFYLRIYPWYSSSATGKTICFADLCIHGMASGSTALDGIIEKHPAEPILLDLNGRRLRQEPQRGLYLRDGHKIAR